MLRLLRRVWRRNTCVAWVVPSQSQDCSSMLSWHSHTLSDSKESESK
ncbi:hypothetical protein PVAP13_1KG439405 [Panicum virgatum]|uniref:Uncharacterized protein n=1 Tax=Panicum virgatum TaxID=38727 RepID=A0A8T0XTM2_PANVG|nr:hypothetical protein PVAP13_1KG439405 [Panicum virgatum]